MDRMIALKLIILVVALQSRETLSSSLSSSSSSSSNVYRLDPVVVVEEPPIGTLVLDLTSTLGLSESQIGEFKFRFYSPQSLTAHYFLIDPLTGHVKTQRTLDREYLCETKVCGPCSTNNCTLPVEIVVASQSKSASIAQKGTAKHHHHAHSQQKFVSFDVVIEDKNEFAPKFPRDTLYLNISETAPANFSIPLDAAVDRDSSSSRITYSIEPEMPNKLALSLYPQLSLVVLQPLDYEVEKELRFKIIATDGTDSGSSNKRLSSSCSVVLRVLDINDNLPQFDRDEYEYRLDEDRAVGGTKLIRVHASDRDDGENGLVKYTLVEQTATSSLQKDQQQRHMETKNLFQIDELSGWISVSPDSTLDYEQASIYRLVVRAQDSGLVNSMPVYTNVLIYLNDINDNRPQINLTLPGFDSSSDEQDTQSQGPIASSNSNLSSIELSEYTAPNSFVAQISVSDADSGANGQVELDMKQFKRQSFSQSSSSHHKWVESSDFELVHLFKNIYSLMTKSQLDRERFDEYRVELRASDSGTQPKPLETVLDVRIYVKDENDNRPVFVNLTSAYGYEFSLVELDSNETKSEPITIGYIKAVDFDSEEHSKITYSIDSPDFRINSETGELTASNSAILDRELTDAYEFNVTASDGLNKESIRVRVEIIDRNDNKPLFDMPLYRFHVVENHVSTSVGVLQAIDVDKPNTGFSRVKYALIDDSSNEDELDDELDNDDDEDDGSLRYSDYFRVNENTGELMQLKPFDYEMVKTVRFKAIAYDNFNKTPTNNSTCIVEITIENENDNRPQLVFPKDSDQPLVFSLDTPSQSTNNSSSIAPTTSSSRQLITRLIATDLDLPNRLTYNLQRQIRIRKQAPDHQHLDLVSLFDVEPETGSVYLRGGAKRASDNIGGFYALIVELNDRQSELNKDEVVQKNVVYVFLALTNSGGNLLTNEINRLRDILNTTRLNDDSDNSDSGYDYSDYSEDESQIRSQDYRFERVLNQLKHDTNLVRLTKKKSNYLGGIGSKSSIIDGTNLAKLKQHLLNSLNTSNYLPLLILVIFSCVALSVLFASLCMLSSYYKRRRTSRNRPEKLSTVLSSSSSSPKRNSGGQIYSDSSYYDKALTTGDEKEEETLSSKVGTSSTAASSQHSNHSSPNSHGHHHHLNQKHTVESGVSSSSASPMSLVSAELIADGAPTDFTDACINMTPSRRLLVKKRGAATTTTTFMSTIDRKNRGKNVPTGTKSQLNEEERAVLIVNTNCSSTSSTTTTTAAASSSSSSASSSSHNNNTHHPHHHHRAHVTSSSQHGTPVRKPSISISNNTAGGGNPLLVLVASSPSHHQANSTTNKPPQVASSESLSSVELNNTNTNTNLKTFKTSTYKQVTDDNSSDNNAGFATMSRTMPRNVHNSHYQQQRHNNLDQRPLNLPVNELFKRYELKRQAMANGANGSVSSSSGGCGSLTSLNSGTANGTNNSQQNGNNNQQINVSTFASPRLAAKIPDYFFKDEKEQRKLMAATSRGGKQLISLKVVESSLNNTTSSTTNPPTTSN